MYYWGKLKKVLKQLKGTKYTKLPLRLDSLEVVNWCMDTSYNTHFNFMGQTGVVMSLGTDAVLRSSLKQKLNVKRST